MNYLSKNIKSLRKSKKMTLKELAEATNLSIGMLSLIENGKSSPSIESLNSISKALNTDPINLLSKVSKNELREILQKLNNITVNSNNDLERIEELIEPILPSLSKDYESAEILFKYSKELYKLDNKNWQTYAIKAKEIYESLHSYDNYCQIELMFSREQMISGHYSQAEQIVNNIYNSFNNSSLITTKTLIDIHLQKIYINISINNYEKALEFLDQAIEIALDKEQLSKITVLYKVKIFLSASSFLYEDVHFYLNKLKEYVYFIQKDEYICDYLFYKTHIHLFFIENPTIALETINLLEKQLSNINEHQREFYYKHCKMIKAVSYVLSERYDEAISLVTHHYTTKYIDEFILPIEKCTFLLYSSYFAIGYAKKGELNKALELASYAVNEMKNFPQTVFHKKAEEILHSIKSHHH